MSFWLTRYTGTGTDADPFRPLGADELGPGQWSAIDLRPDSTVVNGLAILRGPGPLPAVAGRTALGDDPDADSSALKSAIESRLGITLADSNLRRIVRSLLVQFARTDGTRWRPLVREGNRYRIWLGGLFDDFPAVSGGMTALTDNFNRADAGSLGANWTQISGTHSITSNKATASNSPPEHLARHVTDLATVDHYAQADVNGTDGSTVESVMVRMNVPGTDTTANSSCYMGRHNSTVPQWEIFKRVTGSFTSLGTSAGSQAFPYTVRVDCNGSTIRVLLGTTSQLSLTDTAVATGTRVGIRSNDGVPTDHSWDNFQAADLRNALPFSPPQARRVLMRSVR